jgi:nitroreductase
VQLLDALRTTGAVRDFRPDAVPDDVVYRILDSARFAPSGGNRQGWKIVVARDPAVRARLRDLYLPAWYEYLAMAAAGLVPFAPITDHAAAAAARARAPEIAKAAAGGGGGFAEHLDRVPVLLVLLADLRVLAAMDKDLPRYTLVGGASIYPFAWSILLAAREEGLAGVITTMPVPLETDVRTLLGVPDEFAVAGLIAMGRPVKQPRKLNRNPVESFATVDRFDGSPFVAPS